MSLPTPYVLQFVRRVVGAVDNMGNPAESWDTPTDWVVHGWRPGPSLESVQQGREPSNVALTVYAPTAPFTGRDRVQVAGELFDVVGDPMDWTTGPFANPVAGFEVQLKRMEG